MDASAVAGSATALVKAFETFDPELSVAGVVFNCVAGATGHGEDSCLQRFRFERLFQGTGNLAVIDRPHGV